MKPVVITLLALTAVVLLVLVLAAPAPEVPVLPPPEAVWDRPAEPEPPSADAQETVTLLTEEGIVTLPLNTYLEGVVAAEMPASFEPEALKAQAVAARTYTLWKAASGTARHPRAQLCTDPGCRQAYRTPEQSAAAWGADADACAAKIAAAVAETDGLVLRYDGELIEAVFHSSSAGFTQSAVAVWGADLPYLRSVTSGEDALTVPNYYSEAVFSADELRGLLTAAWPAVRLRGEPAEWFSDLTRSAGGSVASLNVGGVTVTGAQLRRVLGLRSASFTISCTEESVCFHVIGYGHGVGMSQYGANLLAQSGLTFREILCWYYTGVTVGE